MKCICLRLAKFSLISRKVYDKGILSPDEKNMNCMMRLLQIAKI